MITVEKLEKGTYFDDAFKISFRYDPTTVAKVKELAERRYLPEDRAWEIPAHELPALIEKVGLSNIKSEEAVVQALNTKEIEDKREATQERLKGIKPVRDFEFKTPPLPHQIELSRKSKLLDAYLDGILNKQEYQKKAEELDERIIQLKAETEKNKANSGDIEEIDKVLANIDEEVSRYVDGNEKLKVEYLLEHLEQVQIFPDKVIVIVPILSEGIVVEKAQYVSREKWCRKKYPYEINLYADPTN